MALTTVPVELANLDGAVTVNESSADVDFRIESNGDTHRLFIDGGNDRLLIGTTASVAMSGVTPSNFLEGTAYASSTLGMAINANGANESPLLMTGKSRGTSLGSNTIVQNGDRLFSLRVHGSDGTNQEQAALIEAHVDAAPGANEIPGRLSFWTTTDGSQYATEKMRIDNAGNVGIGVTPESGWGANSSAIQIGDNADDQGALAWNTISGADKFDLMYQCYFDGTDYKRGAAAAVTQYQQYNGSHRFQVAGSDSADSTITWSNALKIDNSGHVTMPLQPSFLSSLGSTQSNISSDTTVPFTEIIDRNGDFASNTFTAPVTGLYQLNCWLRLQDVPADISGYIIIRITVSNRNFDWIWTTTGFDATQTYLSTAQSVLVDMDANDTAHIVFHQSGGTTGALDIGDGAFSGYLVA